MAERNEFDAFLRIELTDLTSVISQLEAALAKAPDSLDGRMRAVLKSASTDAKNIQTSLNAAKTVGDYERIRKQVHATSIAAQAVNQSLSKAKGGVFNSKSLKDTENKLIKINAATRNIAKSQQRTSLSSLNVLRVIQDSQFGMMGMANNIQELGLSFNQLMQQTGSFSKALSGTFKPLITGPFAIPLVITLMTLVIQNMDKMVSALQSLRVAYGGLNREQKIYLDQLKELQSGELFQNAIKRIVGDVDDIDVLNAKIAQISPQLKKLEADIQSINPGFNLDNLKGFKSLEAAFESMGLNAVTDDERKLRSFIATANELSGTMSQLLARRTEIQEQARAEGFLGLSEDKDTKKVKDLDEAMQRLLATLSRREQKSSLRTELEAIGVEFDEIDRRIKKDFAQRPDLIVPLLEASAGARERVANAAIHDAFDKISKEEAALAKAQLEGAIKEIRRGAIGEIGQMQKLLTNTVTEAIGQFDFDALRDQADAAAALQQGIIDKKQEALLKERELRQGNADAIAQIDAQLLNLDNQRTQTEASNAAKREALRKAEIDGIHSGVQSLLSSTESLFGSLATITAKQGEKGLEQNKALLIAGATADAIAGGISAVRATLNSGMGPLAIPAAFAAGASVFASLMAQVKQIRNVGKGGGAGNASFTGGFTQLNNDVNNQRIDNFGGIRSRRLGQNAQSQANTAAQHGAEQIVAAINDQKVTIDEPTAAQVSRMGNEFNRRKIRTT